jgi:acyl-CoA dehydrogenase
MSDDLKLLAQTADTVFADHGHASLRTGDDLTCSLWRVLDEQGLTRVSVPEPAGAGADVRYLAELLRCAGRAAVSVPLLETHLGACLLRAAGGPDDGGPVAGMVHLSFATDGRPAEASQVGYPGFADDVVVPARIGDAVRVDLWRWSQLGRSVDRNLAGEPVARIDRADLPAPAWSGVCDLTVARRLALLSVLGRAAMLVGAGELALRQTARYVGQREQFGRRLAGFQAVQQTVAVMASLVAAASAATAAATVSLSTSDDSDPRTAFEVIAARIQANRMAAAVARSAHQLHGAIGFTEEHPLRHTTTRLAAWRTAGPSHRELEIAIGRMALKSGDAWTLVAGPSPSRWRAGSDHVQAGAEVGTAVDL